MLCVILQTRIHVDFRCLHWINVVYVYYYRFVSMNISEQLLHACATHKIMSGSSPRFVMNSHRSTYRIIETRIPFFFYGFDCPCRSVRIFISEAQKLYGRFAEDSFIRGKLTFQLMKLRTKKWKICSKEIQRHALITNMKYSNGWRSMLVLSKNFFFSLLHVLISMTWNPIRIELQ